MKLKIKVHSNSSQEKIIKINEKSYEIWIKEKPIGGRANFRIEKLLKRELGFRGKIVSGFTSKIKLVKGEFF